MKQFLTGVIGVVAGLVIGGGVVLAAAPAKYVNNIYRDSENGMIGVFDDQNNKCYVYYGTGGKNDDAGKAIACLKK